METIREGAKYVAGHDVDLNKMTAFGYWGEVLCYKNLCECCW